MKLEWQIDTPVEPGLLSLMQTAADRTAEVEGIKLPCCASVRLCGEEEIRELNARFRNTNRPTDVLSFPDINWPPGKTAGQEEKRLRRAWDEEAGACFLGDIVISVPRIFSQAQEYGHSAAREAAYLLVHALCHLMGYDHMEEEEKRVMRTQEEKILSSVGISRDENNTSDDTLLSLAVDAMERSYSPYSHYPVGAALRCTDGRIFQGCNIENGSCGVTCCAERVALFKAVSEGARHFDAIAVACKDPDSPPWPCEICHQALSEFSPDIRVLIIDGKGQSAEARLSGLLPHQFGLNQQKQE